MWTYLCNRVMLLYSWIIAYAWNCNNYIALVVSTKSCIQWQKCMWIWGMEWVAHHHYHHKRDYNPKQALASSQDSLQIICISSYPPICKTCLLMPLFMSSFHLTLGLSALLPFCFLVLVFHYHSFWSYVQMDSR